MFVSFGNVEKKRKESEANQTLQREESGKQGFAFKLQIMVRKPFSFHPWFKNITVF